MSLPPTVGTGIAMLPDTAVVGTVELSGQFVRDTGAAAYLVTLCEVTKSYITFGNQSTALAGLVKAPGTNLLPTGGTASITAEIPVENFFA